MQASCSLLALDKSAHADLTQQLARMAEAGLVTELPGGKYRAPRHPPRARPARDSAARNSAADGGQDHRHHARPRGRGQAETRVGRLSMHARGFGFVVTEEP